MLEIKKYVYNKYMRKRKYTKEQVAKAVKESFSIAGVLRKIGLKPIFYHKSHYE